ncbi:hypothetical protein LEP1GSC173_1132 [Leptospira interrogans str. HAI1594]|uniref:Uncharacterized protein n=2 Tax=Leptospira interrogans TaxID=173 RepID=M6RD31_LEPIR|nr:hypothetical protein LEP1GSC117_3693 [Leptospira interrogans serovar Icterohaemorrhagiae str. Verdun LP]EKP75806.1 hypothetical protein LEP1GSC173_1132 [Leptospira interrogans str. HAI1594]EKR27396.1 hypothetical protein LEP1GSC087_1567 [Leptospira interrogans serovar Bataviae str. L1111]EMG23854.1 hypothetical protein LEP1GSC150_2619 [Leptospira interrogans serovar Copenhageni str. LT2050]EMO03621.1 hypothetical protein LEP1GSC116_4064 [Leptospira interrogans serovar Icterohaemorrhagiae str
MSKIKIKNRSTNFILFVVGSRQPFLSVKDEKLDPVTQIKILL